VLKAKKCKVDWNVDEGKERRREMRLGYINE
jgi:hypothetical protein